MVQTLIPGVSAPILNYALENFAPTAWGGQKGGGAGPATGPAKPQSPPPAFVLKKMDSGNYGELDISQNVIKSNRHLQKNTFGDAARLSFDMPCAEPSGSPRANAMPRPDSMNILTASRGATPPASHGSPARHIPLRGSSPMHVPGCGDGGAGSTGKLLSIATPIGAGAYASPPACFSYMGQRSGDAEDDR
ncbi:hypothetical protein FOA52_008089 [Chlamydomonas sp. UWO 241]|nr:hypothetical protein FOA52_008089 [Chlamydomonas sp. UWO 241]